MNWKKFKRFYGKSDGNWCSFIHLTVYIEQFRYCFHVQNNIKEKYDIILISNQIKRRWVKAILIEWKLIGGMVFFVHYPIVFSAFLRTKRTFCGPYLRNHSRLLFESNESILVDKDFVSIRKMRYNHLHSTHDEWFIWSHFIWIPLFIIFHYFSGSSICLVKKLSERHGNF